MAYFRVPRFRVILCGVGHFDLSNGISYVISDRHASLSFIDPTYETPVVLDFKRDIIKISVTSVFGNLYETYLIPDGKGELEPFESYIGDALPKGVWKPYKDGEIIGTRTKDFETMKKNAELVLKNREFKDEFNKLVAQDEIKREMFTEDMTYMLGFSSNDERNAVKRAKASVFD